MSNKVCLEENDPPKQKKLLFVLNREKKAIKWSKEDDGMLLSLAEKYNNKNWNKVAKYFDGKTGIQCCSRYKLINPKIKKGHWTVEEDRNLLELIEVYGKNWRLLSKIIKIRSGKQIRDRYLNYLDRNINKDRLTENEEKIILNLYTKFGPNWTLIAKHLPGRTNQQIKNKCYGSLIYGLYKDNMRVESQNSTFPNGCEANIKN